MRYPDPASLCGYQGLMLSCLRKAFTAPFVTSRTGWVLGWKHANSSLALRRIRSHCLDRNTVIVYSSVSDLSRRKPITTEHRRSLRRLWLWVRKTVMSNEKAKKVTRLGLSICETVTTMRKARDRAQLLWEKLWKGLALWRLIVVTIIREWSCFQCRGN